MTIKFKCDAVKTSEEKKYISLSAIDESIVGNLYLTVAVGSAADTFEQGEQFFITFEDVIE